tara:strand:+ start:299 stop:2410 length:2112 start_codon:yes stop_codon:yes gene_type:complete
MSNTDLKVQILFEATGDKELAKAFTAAANAQKKLDRTTEKLADSNRELSRTKARLKRRASGLSVNFLRLQKSGNLLSVSFATIRSRLLLLSFATSLVSGSVGKLTNIFGKQEKAERALSQAIGGTSTRLLEYASALQAKTSFGDEDIIQVQATLSQYTNEEEKLKDLTSAVLDFATAKGMDLNSASELVGKSIGSSTNALSRYGITIQGAVGSQERFNSAMKGLTKEGILGQAEAQADTFSGRMQQAQNLFGDVAELIGKELIPAVDKIVVKFVVFAKQLLKQEKEFNMLKLAMKTLAAPFKLINALNILIIGYLKEFWNATYNLRVALANFLVPIFETVITVMSQVATGVFNLGKMFARLLVGDIDGAKEAAHRAVTTFSNMSTELDKNTNASEDLTKGLEFIDKATGGLINDYLNLDDVLGAVNEKQKDNKNNLDNANRALLTHIDLNQQVRTALGKVAERQAFLSQTTLQGENEHKSYVKTLADFNKATGLALLFTDARSMAELEAFITRTFQNEEERKQILKLIQAQKEYNDATTQGAISNKEARQQGIRALSGLGQAMSQLAPENKKLALVSIRLQQIEAVATAYQQANKFLGRPVLYGLTLARGLANAALIEKQFEKARAAAIGADFITQGRQTLVVGDNPTGRERVQVTPLGNTASAGGGDSSVTINLNGNVLGTDEFVRDELIPQIENAVGRNLA